jgi:hypothetical protein
MGAGENRRIQVQGFMTPADTQLCECELWPQVASVGCFRMHWGDSNKPGADASPPVWVLGLAGILQLFQDMPGTGFCLVSSLGGGCGCLNPWNPLNP